MWCRWELILLIPACLLLMAAGCRTQLPAEFSRMGETGLNSPAPSPGGGLDAGAPLAGEQDALANPDVEQEQEPEVPTGGRFAADGLYAIPQQTSAAVGEAVRIVVATGVTARPFQYMNSVRVTFSAGEPSYVPGSYNVGAIGGALEYADGIWAVVQPEGFLLPTDYMLGFNNYDDASGSWAMDFNVTPISGRQIDSREGELFNFEVTFAHAGTVVLGFEEFNQVKRTYFSDGSSTEYYWSDISNDHDEGSANTINVE